MRTCLPGDDSRVAASIGSPFRSLRARLTPEGDSTYCEKSAAYFEQIRPAHSGASRYFIANVLAVIR